MDPHNPIAGEGPKGTGLRLIDPREIFHSDLSNLIDDHRIEVFYDSEGFCRVQNTLEGQLLAGRGDGLIAALLSWIRAYNKLQQEEAE